MTRRIAACITFYYRHSRLPFLQKTIRSLSSIPAQIDLFIVSNADLRGALDVGLQSLYQNVNVQCRQFDVPGHPLLFPWCHFSVWRQLDLGLYSHFLYLEDDLSFSAPNFEYWCRWREILRSSQLIPGFIRYETEIEGSTRYATDLCATQFLPFLPRLCTPTKYTAVNLLYPYQGMYIFDQELMNEFLSSPASSPNFGVWKIQEKAAQGLTFYNIPRGFYSRIAVPVESRSRLVLNEAFVEHSCASYVGNRASRLAKIPVNRIFGRFPSPRFFLRGLVILALDSYLLRNRN